MTIPGPTPGNLIDTIDQLVLAANAGGGVVLGNYSTDFVGSSLSISVPMDGASHSVPVINNSPPDWINGSGAILLPGLYALCIVVGITTPPTTPGLYSVINSAFNISQVFPIDGIVAMNSSHCLLDIQSLSTGDLPYPTNGNVKIQTDVTGVLNVSPFIIRLAH